MKWLAMLMFLLVFQSPVTARNITGGFASVKEYVFSPASSLSPAAGIQLLQSSDESQDSTQPEEYDKSEFPDPLLKIRRFEIITVGSLPFTYLFTSIAYDYFLYVNNDFDSLYSPWPFKNPAAPPYETSDYLTILASAAVVSVSIATADFIIGLIQSD